MPRQRRIQIPGLLRHVTSRGNGRMPIFLDDGDYREFIYVLGEVCENFAIECWSYCIMPNHYHAALRTERPNFSAAIQHLNGEYAKWWNRKHRKVGHTFQGRFKDQIVQREGYLLTLLRYIALNPVRAGLVDCPSKWRWGSFPALAGAEPAPPFLRASSVLATFGGGEPEELCERFAAYVLREEPEGASLQDRIRSNERVLGDALFKHFVRSENSPECQLTGV